MTSRPVGKGIDSKQCFDIVGQEGQVKKRKQRPPYSWPWCNSSPAVIVQVKYNKRHGWNLTEGKKMMKGVSPYFYHVSGQFY